MLTVPSLQDGTILKNPIKGNAPAANTYGAFDQSPITNEGAVTQKMVQTGFDIYSKEKSKADDSTVLEAQSRMSDFELGWHDKMLNTKGVNALGLQKELNSEWSSFQSKLKKDLSNNDKQALAIEKSAQTYKRGIDRKVLVHTNSEQTKVHEQTYNTLLTKEQLAASANNGNKERIQDALDRQTAATVSFGTSQGWTDDAIKEQILSNFNKTHIDIINELAESDPNRAMLYYEENKAEIDRKQMNAKKLASQIGQIKKAKSYENLKTQVTNEMGLLNKLRTGTELSVEDIAAESVSENVRPEFAQAYTKFLTNVDDIDRQNDDGFSAYVDAVFKSTSKAGINKTIIAALEGGGDKKISRANLERLILSAGDQFEYVEAVAEGSGKKAQRSFISKLYDVSKLWASTMGFSPVTKSTMSSIFIDKMYNREGKTEMEVFDEVKQETLDRRAIEENPDSASFTKGQNVISNGISYRVVGFDDDRNPLFEEM